MSTDQEAPTNEADRDDRDDDIDDGPLDPQTQRALDFVDMLLEKMDMDAEVTLAPDDGEGSADEIRLEIEGPDAGRVIGKRGSVLEAIQYLTTRVAHRPGEPRKHIAVDAEGYRARHEDQLAEMAQKLARRVAKEGKVITFDPMTARDRRVVHMALKDITDVRTESHGEGPDRRVQIIPVKAGAGGVAEAGVGVGVGEGGGAPREGGGRGGRGRGPRGGGGGRGRGGDGGGRRGGGGEGEGGGGEGGGGGGETPPAVS